MIVESWTALESLGVINSAYNIAAETSSNAAKEFPVQVFQISPDRGLSPFHSQTYDLIPCPAFIKVVARIKSKISRIAGRIVGK